MEENKIYTEAAPAEPEEVTTVQEEDTEEVEYEDVKRMPMGAFVAIGLAFGVAAGFSAGNLLFGSFALGMGVFLGLGLIGGLVFGLVNKTKRKPE